MSPDTLPSFWTLYALTLGGFLVGSLPFSAWIARWRAGVDLRRVGDGNVGAHNCGRAAGLLWGVICALLDGSKGALIGWLTLQSALPPPLRWWPGVTTLFGHQYPLFLRFRGGKGISTALGFLLMLYPTAILKALAVILLLYVTLRNLDLALTVGLASIVLLWLPTSGVPRADLLRVAGYLALIGLKKLLDLPYERWVREQSRP